MINHLIIYQGTPCSTETVTVTVTSDCTPEVMGVTLTSTELMETSSSGPGIYEISACSLPIIVTFKRNGYIPVTQEIATDTAASLSCIGKINIRISYRQTCVKWPLSKDQKLNFQYQL